MKPAVRIVVAVTALAVAGIAVAGGAADSRTDSAAAAPVAARATEPLPTTPAAVPTSVPVPAAAPADPCTFTNVSRFNAVANAAPAADRLGGVGFDTSHCEAAGTVAWAVAWNRAEPPVGALFRFDPSLARWTAEEIGPLGDCVGKHGVPPEIAAELPGC